MPKTSPNAKNARSREICEAFGARLRHVRQRLSLSQSAFAAAVGHSIQDGISRLERGRATAISFDTLFSLAAICREANVDYEWLLTGTAKAATQAASPQAIAEALVPAIAGVLQSMERVKRAERAS